MVLSVRKTVRFSLEESVWEYSSTCIAAEEVWWQTCEYDQIRQDALTSVRVARKRGLDALIKSNYGCTDDKTQSDLNIWSKCKDSLRGLERFVCEEYGVQRLQHRKKIIEAVIYAQAKMADGKRTNRSAANIIRTVSSTLSQNATQFARMLAIADSAAVSDREMMVRVRSNGTMSNQPAKPPTGKSPITARKHQRNNGPSSLPPRHPGSVRCRIRVSPSA
ncbi:hypothetical protein IV203_037936 [Nitzschia inconspicua]|uniref:Uncharacterized protein n=1 Tax=Nitzschia inconspicua TaxID=303405 RepID=A0A9K3LMW7_9STRA|nr:hypothetical protein IV203_037936 [Nitzschia inconspicua]